MLSAAGSRGSSNFAMLWNDTITPEATINGASGYESLPVLRCQSSFFARTSHAWLINRSTQASIARPWK